MNMRGPRLRRLLPMRVDKAQSLGDLLDCMKSTAFGGRELGAAWSVLERIASDPSYFTVLTISGAMTVAKMGPLFAQWIEHGIVNCVITTGAVITHSLVEETGGHHFRMPPETKDSKLRELGLNRVYDSIESDKNLDRVAARVLTILRRLPPHTVEGSSDLVRAVSEGLNLSPSGLVGAAVKNSVPIFVPALTDSELGLWIFETWAGTHGNNIQLDYSPMVDLLQYSSLLLKVNKLAIVSVGGGVPRNWAQQMIPFLECGRLPLSLRKRRRTRFSAGIRICPDSPAFGHLSGSSYSEAVSWGKVDQKLSHFAEVHCDATIAFPILTKALIDFLPSKTRD
jgi:deoxyhypusine synthase